MRTAIALFLILSACSASAATEYRNGKNLRDGWRVTPNRIQGTGENFRKGYQKSASGTWYGTGKDFGKYYRPGAR